jgi:hypothetical protein
MESGRAGALLESLSLRQRLEAVALPAPLLAEEAAARKRHRLALWRYRAALEAGHAADAAWAEVQTAQGEIAAVIARTQREAKAQAGLLYPEADSVHAIRLTLGPGEALVSYGTVPTGMTALVVTPDGARLVDLDPQLRPVVEAFQRAVSRPDERGVAAPPHERLPFLRDRLAKLLIEPLELDAKRLLVSPDGLLAYVPFSVLTDREVA